MDEKTYMVYDPYLCGFVEKTKMELERIEKMVNSGHIKTYGDLLVELGFPLNVIELILNNPFMQRIDNRVTLDDGYWVDQNGYKEMKTIRVV